MSKKLKIYKDFTFGTGVGKLDMKIQGVSDREDINYTQDEILGSGVPKAFVDTEINKRVGSYPISVPGYLYIGDREIYAFGRKATQLSFPLISSGENNLYPSGTVYIPLVDIPDGITTYYPPDTNSTQESLMMEETGSAPINISAYASGTITSLLAETVTNVTAGTETNTYAMDWFLPSIDELKQIYINLYYTELDVSMAGEFCWSSTEEDEYNAFGIYFSTPAVTSGEIDTEVSSDAKLYEYYFRPVRTFSSPDSYSIGDDGPAGGLIFYASGDIYWEYSPIPTTNTYHSWSNIQDSLVGTYEDIGSGESNTNSIVQQDGHLYSAAGVCKDYSTISGTITIPGTTVSEVISMPLPFFTHNDDSMGLRLSVRESQSIVSIASDWFLPSQEELILMFINLHNNGIGDFEEGATYWTSSEDGPGSAYTIVFTAGDMTIVSTVKAELHKSRPVRLFTTQDTYSLGDIGPAGGFIFYKTENTYLECATVDTIEQVWSNVYTREVGTSTSLLTGQSNTTAIVSQLEYESPEWFLPSLDELWLVTEFLNPVGEAYATSSERDATYIYVLTYESDAWVDSNNWYNKGYSWEIRQLSVLPFRSFTSSTAYSVGDYGPAGGYIVYADGDNYLECAPTSLPEKHAWTQYYSYIHLVGTSTDIGTGKTNTAAIINEIGTPEVSAVGGCSIYKVDEGHTKSAAKLCGDYCISNIVTIPPTTSSGGIDFDSWPVYFTPEERYSLCSSYWREDEPVLSEDKYFYDAQNNSIVLYNDNAKDLEYIVEFETRNEPFKITDWNLNPVKSYPTDGILCISPDVGNISIQETPSVVRLHTGKTKVSNERITITAEVLSAKGNRVEGETVQFRIKRKGLQVKQVFSSPTNDWYLPSIDELSEVYSVYSTYGVGNIRPNQYYWSSTEMSEFGANAINMDDGGVSYEDKSASHYAVPVRSFSGTVGEYNIGDIGPSGGWIFYNTEASIYYEFSSYNVGPHPWSNVTNAEVGTLSGKGYGQSNSIAMESYIQTAGECAASLANDYSISGESGWYLPTLNEFTSAWWTMKTTYPYGVMATSGNYWCSTESDSNPREAYYVAVIDRNISPDIWPKDETASVMAMRKFWFSGEEQVLIGSSGEAGGRICMAMNTFGPCLCWEVSENIGNAIWSNIDDEAAGCYTSNSNFGDVCTALILNQTRSSDTVAGLCINLENVITSGEAGLTDYTSTISGSPWSIIPINTISGTIIDEIDIDSYMVYEQGVLICNNNRLRGKAYTRGAGYLCHQEDTYNLLSFSDSTSYEITDTTDINGMVSVNYTAPLNISSSFDIDIEASIPRMNSENEGEGIVGSISLCILSSNSSIPLYSLEENNLWSSLTISNGTVFNNDGSASAALIYSSDVLRMPYYCVSPSSISTIKMIDYVTSLYLGSEPTYMSPSDLESILVAPNIIDPTIMDPSQENMVLNGSFETGVHGWIHRPGGGSYAQITQSSTHAKTGVYSAKTNGLGYAEIISPGIEVIPGVEYLLTAWVYSEHNSYPVSLSSVYSISPFALYVYDSRSSIAGGEWVQLSCSFTPTVENGTTIYICLASYTEYSMGSFYWDDIVLVPIGLSGWVSHSSVDMSIEYSTYDYLFGDHSIAITSDSGDTTSHYMTPEISVTPGTQYTCSIYTKSRTDTIGDWYLPSKDELNLMYVNLWAHDLGHFDW